LAVDGSVGSGFVVVGAESEQLAGERGGRGCWGLGGEPFLLGLVEPFDLPAGLRMVGAGVVEADAEAAEFDLERDPAAADSFAGESAGEDHAVVGEHRGGDSPAQERFLEGVYHVGGGEGDADGGGEGQSGVVVDQVEDLHGCAVGELPVGDVGLPAFVGLLGTEGPP
jgi:hypothetical protein